MSRLLVSGSRFARAALRDIFKNGLLTSSVIPPRLRPYLLWPWNVRGIGSRIAPRVFIGSGRLIIGSGSFLNYECFIDPSAGITLGRNVACGPRVMMITATHLIGATEETRTRRLPEDNLSLPIVVNDNVWIGAGVTVLPGVVIDSGVVVAAGAVVTQDCERNFLYGGVPATKIRSLPR
ncbi:acyltransferase [Nocardioides lacus]|uniref:acyltransferase n=1 Tax=Nocardioides sp. BP30 TaxID=3036374 RepID=UPI00406C91DB